MIHNTIFNSYRNSIFFNAHERLRGAFTTRHYTNPRLPYLTLPY